MIGAERPCTYAHVVAILHCASCALNKVALNPFPFAKYLLRHYLKDSSDNIMRALHSQRLLWFRFDNESQKRRKCTDDQSYQDIH
jgi:hypothetical protein